jgi:hypothetical protein
MITFTYWQRKDALKNAYLIAERKDTRAAEDFKSSANATGSKQSPGCFL